MFLTKYNQPNSVFDLAFDNFLSENFKGNAWQPNTDIVETEKSFELELDLAGLSKDDVKINLENGLLSISGERKSELESVEKGFKKIERKYGSFSRYFTLPKSVDTESITANFKNGVLKISILKKEEAKPKQIEISVN
jgi:HSP20 family protein